MPKDGIIFINYLVASFEVVPYILSLEFSLRIISFSLADFQIMQYGCLEFLILTSVIFALSISILASLLVNWSVDSERLLILHSNF